MIDPCILRGALAAALIGLLGTSAASAQVNDLYQLRIESASVPLGGTVALSVTLDSAGGNIEGWSFGVCHDQTRLTGTTIAPGSTTLTVKNGSPADFAMVNEYATGWTAGVVICLTGCAVLPPGMGYELYVANYQEIGGDPNFTDVCFCDSLGSPPVYSIVVVGAQSMTPETHCGTVESVDSFPYRFRAADAIGTYSPLDGVGSVVADLFVRENDLVAAAQNTEAFAMGVSHDPTLLIPTGVTTTGPVASLGGGSGPDFFGPNLMASGVTVGVVYSFLSTQTVQFANESAVARIHYDTVASNLAGNDIGTTTPLQWSDLLGAPPVRNVMVVSGTSLGVELVGGSIELIATVATPFKRGDCNGDSALNLADGIWLLNYLFLNGPSRECISACDTDDNDDLGILDAVLLIQHWIIGGPPPAAPYPGCGIDTNAICPVYPGCP